MQEALLGGSREAALEEIGDLLFTAAQLARFAGVEPEEALTRATDKFVARFAAVESAVTADGKDLALLNDVEKDIYWQKIKKATKI